MAMQISCNELGIQGCNFVASGATPGEVIRKVVDHVRARHDVDLPDADAILDGRLRDTPMEGANPGAETIVKRLAEKLDTAPPAGPDAPGTALGRMPNE
jgi:predicted small metal-binding protein